MKYTMTIVALLLSTTTAMADNIPQGGVKDSPAGIRPVAIGNGTPNQGVIRLDSENGQTYHAVDQTTTYRRAQGGTTVVNGGDGFLNAHEAELRNRQALLDSIPTPTNGKDGADGRDGINGVDGRDFDASGYYADLASSTALGGLQYQSLSEGETGWAVGIGGQYQGDTAIAVGINHAITDDFSVSASISSTFDGEGVSAFVGASGTF